MVYFSEGSKESVVDKNQISVLLDKLLLQIGKTSRVLILPPDLTRFDSYAGEITRMLYYKLKDLSHVEIMPALGTHLPLTDKELGIMYEGIPYNLFRVHNWKSDVVRLGTIPPGITAELTDDLVDFSIDCEINKLLVEGNWDQIISVGQVVPHELAGMANYNKNIFVGVGGKEVINKSHFIGALYGLENLMGHSDSPVRRVFNYMSENFTNHLPITYIMTVRGTYDDNKIVTRGIYSGDDEESFLMAAGLSREVNIKLMEKEYRKVVAFLDPEEFKSTWVGNKAIFRTRMAIADGGELIILCPGINTFGEHPDNDRVIRQYGYQSRDKLIKAVKENSDLANNLATVAHLIISSPDNRFTVTYAASNISKHEIESVHCNYADFDEMIKRYDPSKLKEGVNNMPDGEEIFYVPKPAQGLWAENKRFGKYD